MQRNAAQRATDNANILGLLSELKTMVNNLRNDFLNHDHGGTYAATAVRINTTTTTCSLSGIMTNSPAVTALPMAFADDETGKVY